MPGAKSLEKKKQKVEALKKSLSDAMSVVLTDFRGLTVEQDTELRNALRKAGVEYRVVKNTLMIHAVKECGFKGLEQFLTGPTAIALSSKDYVSPAKVMIEYSKKFEKLHIKGGIIDGNAVEEGKISQIAELPSREILISRVLGGLNAPISGFVNVLAGNIRALAVVLNAAAQKKAS